MSVVYSMMAGLKAMQEVNDILTERGDLPVNPLASVAFLAKDENGSIVDMVLVHSVPVISHMRMENPRVGLELMKMAEDFIKGSKARLVLMRSGHPTIQTKLEKMGARPSPEPMFEWVRS